LNLEPKKEDGGNQEVKHRYLNMAMAAFTLSGVLTTSIGGAAAAPASQTNKFADPAFQRTWERTDALVASNKVKRSFYWGPQPNTGPLQEAYAEGQGGTHLVQYFDKSRMEINDPTADKNNPFYVTNGLLTVELITGRMQIGNNKFANRYHANIPLASDTDDPTAPTYATFLSPYKYDFVGVNAVGAVLTSFISRDEPVKDVARFASYGVKNVYLEKATMRGIPGVFWDFLNTTGPVMVDGKQQTAKLSDPYFYATGYPVTNAFWATVKIAGKPNTDVLIQAYERRVLTYVPSLPKEFQVQMGNIGQHYYDWRYKNAGLPAPVTACAKPPGGFGELWSRNTVVQNQLRCSEEWEQANIQIQHFERGHMIYVNLINVPPRTSAQTTAVYVFADSGEVVSYFPDRKLNDPGPQENPPTGLFKPSGEPGTLWRESAEARKLVGWATSGLKDVGEEERQFFQSGLMVGDEDRIYMFYNEEFFFYAYPRYWAIYDSPKPFPTRGPIDGRSCNSPPPQSKLWFENLLVQNRLGCPDSTAKVSVAIQPFQFGALVYLNIESPRPPGLPSDKLIYALTYPGKVAMYVDTFTSATPEPPLMSNVPPGLFEPRLGFGKAWRDNKLADKIGWATARERTLSAQESLIFQHGLILVNGKNTYVLYGTDTGRDTPGFTSLQSWYLYVDRP
jgi:hypothetical protein